MKRLREKLKLNDRGAGLVMVIVAIGMILILVSVLMSISLLNYQMKITEKKSKDNFYDAEQVMDEIHAGLEEIVSQAADAAYTQAMQSFSDSSITEAQRVTTFRNQYLSNLRKALRSSSDSYYLVGGKADGQDPDENGLYTTGLCRFLDTTLVAAMENGRLEVTCERAAGSASMELLENGLILHDLRVGYTDKDEYYSEIQTDILIGFPNITMTSGGTVPDFFDYSLIADDSIVFEGAKLADTVTASVSAGEGGISVKSGAVTFQANADDELPRIVSGGMISLLNGASLDMTADQIWAEGIEVTGSTVKGTAGKNNTALTVKADTYISDDLTLNDYNISAKVSGKYYGYGTGSATSTTPDTESAMILNCGNSTLDLTGLDYLLLEGNSYLNGKTIANTTADSTLESTEESNTDSTLAAKSSDVMLGTSLASKLDQVAFLVPAECLASGTNPMTKSQAEAWLELDASARMYTSVKTNLLRQTLGEYGLSAKSYKTIYRVVNSSGGTETLCYVYLDFGTNDEMAARYYREYVSAAETKIRTYLNKYNNNILYDEDQTETVANGNLLTYIVNSADADSSDLTIIKDSYSSLNSDDKTVLSQQMSQYESTYKALLAKLTVNYATLTSSERSRTVYYNVVNTAELANVSGAETYGDSSTGATAIVANGVDVEVGSGSDNASCALVITSGNVTVKGDFSGLILAGGVITVDTNYGGTISSDKLTVTELLQCKLSDAADSKTIAGAYLIDGEDYLISGSTGAGTESTVDLESIITYVNWTKQ